MAKRNIIAALLLIGIAVWYGGMTAELPARPVPNTPGPSFFPWLIAASLLLLSLALLVQGLSRLRTREEAVSASAVVPWRPVAMLVLFVAYLAALPHAGFPAASIPFFAGMMLLYGGRGWPLVVLTSVVVPVALFFLFRDGFHILLPRGGW